MFEVDIFRERYRCIFVVVAKHGVRHEATLRSMDKVWTWPAGKGRLVGRVVRIIVEEPVVCRGVIVIKRVSIIITVLNIQRDVCGDIGGNDSFLKRNRHNRDFHYNRLASAVVSGISSPRHKTSQARDCPSKVHPSIPLFPGDGIFVKLVFSRRYSIFC